MDAAYRSPISTQKSTGFLQAPDPGDNGLMCYEWDYEPPTEEAPIVSSSSLFVLQARKEEKGEEAVILKS